MLYNKKFNNYNNFILKYLLNFNYFHFEIYNILFIILQNFLFLNKYYISPKLNYDYYNLFPEYKLSKIFNDIKILSYIQIIILIIIIIIWIYFRLIITIGKNYIIKYNKKFLINNKNIKNKIEIINIINKSECMYNIIKILNKDINFISRIKIIIWNSILNNSEINIFLFSLILNIFFIILGKNLFIVIQILFIFHIVKIIKIIIKNIIFKQIKNLFFCFLFIILIIYIFSWFNLFYFKNLFLFSNSYEYIKREFITEDFCESFLQCFLFNLLYNLNSITDIEKKLPKLTYKIDKKIFYMRFLYDIIFYIFIIIILGNIIIGLIINIILYNNDNNNKYNNFIKNKCIICKFNIDEFLKKRNTSFEYHIKNEHNIWYYIYYIIYFNLYNKFEFDNKNKNFD